MPVTNGHKPIIFSEAHTVVSGLLLYPKLSPGVGGMETFLETLWDMLNEDVARECDLRLKKRVLEIL